MTSNDTSSPVTYSNKGGPWELRDDWRRTLSVAVGQEPLAVYETTPGIGKMSLAEPAVPASVFPCMADRSEIALGPLDSDPGVRAHWAHLCWIRGGLV